MNQRDARADVNIGELLVRTMVVLLISILSGCSSSQVATDDFPYPTGAYLAIRDARTVEVFALDPSPVTVKSSAKKFHDWIILGSAEITDSATRNGLVAALVTTGEPGNSPRPEAEFAPRYGLRAILNGKQNDFVLCFQCNQCVWYIDEKEIDWFLFSGSPQPAFERVLREASVKLPTLAD